MNFMQFIRIVAIILCIILVIWFYIVIANSNLPLWLKFLILN